MTATAPPNPNQTILDSSVDDSCAACGEIRLAMIDGVCVSCVLDGMGAGADNLMPRVYKPTSRERLDAGILTNARRLGT